jgi:hypothetical protein
MNKKEEMYENIEQKKEHIRRIEATIRKKPSSADLRESVKLLKDFGIIIQISDIPDLRSVCELEKWRIKKICEYLDTR